MSLVVYCLRNSDGEYISMSGGLTKNWLEASKFYEESIETRLKYAHESFELIEFEIKETKML